MELVSCHQDQLVGLAATVVILCAFLLMKKKLMSFLCSLMVEGCHQLTVAQVVRAFCEFAPAYWQLLE